MILLDALAFRRDGHQVIKTASLEIPSGTHTLIVGPNGSGKTTFLALVAGLFRPSSGRVLIDGQPVDGVCRQGQRVLLQDPSAQILLSDIRDEIAFGLLNVQERRAVAQTVTIWERWLNLPHSPKYSAAVQRPPSKLSGGQQQLLVLASLMASGPRILLLDEPTSMLDDDNTSELLHKLDELQRDNPLLTILHATHDPRVVRSGRPCLAVLNGQISPEPSLRTAPTRSLSLEPGAFHSPPLVVLTGLTARISPTSALFEKLALKLSKGDTVCILGGNGSGKTTLLDMIAGFAVPTSGNIVKSSNLRIGYLMQRTEDTLLRSTVFEELLASASTVHSSQRTDRVERALKWFQIEPFRNRDPARMSGGERRRLALAAITIAEPGLILLDEPFIGLDQPYADWMAHLIFEWTRSGAAVIFTTPTLAVLPKMAAHVISLTTQSSQTNTNTPSSALRHAT